MTTTKTQWAVCYCRDGLHSTPDHESWQSSPNKPHHTLTHYEPTGHILKEEIESTITVVAYGAASPQAIDLGPDIVTVDLAEPALHVRLGANRHGAPAATFSLAGGAR